ncbi:response regulator [Sphingomonas histidinilytica]|jgi:two-component system OmpR family response regulator|uniref:Two-component system, OmpR family, response regulator n=1 Tax=Rhizorhabdus histidinilytica TaxID=439228 RepID=A0A1T5FZC2_9SPHN|nr:response regulator [Rhizorhabdus histidinilytica]MBO9375920.1 response regulator [Rhizorhabdus histidinilytica]QEH81445.1 response regulator [Sphingomonas sp. C8-2]SKC01457.1 two-component system, OmpR family, response regulator [Rhizorhabdus histidinilytica]
MSGGNPLILVVDDDGDLRTLITDFLRTNGLRVESAADGAEMDARIAAERPDLIVLDLMMPGEDGLSILRRVRKPGGPAVIMLSAMGEDTDRIIGLEVGADDYLPKPCNPRELLARIRAVLRRRGEEAAAAGTSGAVRRFGAWTLDIVQREVRRLDAPAAPLTDAEFRVLAAFLDRPQRVLSRDQLIEAGKGVDSDVFDRAIDVTISRLRKKLGPDDPIRTIRNEGYMFTLKVEGE